MTRASLTSKLGTIEFGVVSEERPDFVSDVTEHPIEDGRLIADHTTLRPVNLAIDGVVAGPGTAGILDAIRSWREDRLLVTYSGRGIYRDFIIKEFRPTEDAEVGDGFRFTMTLREVRIVSPATILRVKRDPALPDIVTDQQTATQVKPVTDKGRQQPKESPGLVSTVVSTISTMVHSIFSRLI